MDEPRRTYTTSPAESMPSPNDSIEAQVALHDYTVNPATRRSGSPLPPTAAQRALWLRGYTGSKPDGRVDSRTVLASSRK